MGRVKKQITPETTFHIAQTLSNTPANVRLDKSNSRSHETDEKYTKGSRASTRHYHFQKCVSNLRLRIHVCLHFGNFIVHILHTLWFNVTTLFLALSQNIAMQHVSHKLAIKRAYTCTCVCTVIYSPLQITWNDNCLYLALGKPNCKIITHPFSRQCKQQLEVKSCSVTDLYSDGNHAWLHIIKCQLKQT